MAITKDFYYRCNSDVIHEEKRFTVELPCTGGLAEYPCPRCNETADRDYSGGQGSLLVTITGGGTRAGFRRPVSRRRR